MWQRRRRWWRWLYCNRNNANCASADPFCTGQAYNVCNTTGVASLGGGGIYGCLGSTPNPAFYYLNIATGGNINIGISQFTTAGTPIDVDFVLWGPFGSQAAMCGGLASTNIESCSYSASATETAQITGANAGEWYMLLLTNFSNQAGYIDFSQSGGTGSTNCNIINPCTVTAAMTPVTCNGGANGTATGTIVSGTPTYTYAWSPAPGAGQGTLNATGLTAQTYTLTVTQSGGGVCSTTVAVTQPAVLNASTTQVNVLCFGQSTGSITVTATGGVAPYNISWSGTTTGNPGGTEIAASGGTYTLSALPAGTYNITVTDANGCTRVIPVVTITQPTALAASGVATAPACVGGTNGSINVTASGSTAGYNVSWTGTSTGNPAGTEIAASGGTYNITGLAAGSYTVTVTSANGCTTNFPVTVNPGVTINANITPVTAQCLTGNNFTFSGATSTISSGTITSYTWSWGDATANGTGVSASHTYTTAGTFTVTLTASNGTCTNTETFNVTVNANPTVTIAVTNPGCFGGTGTLTANPTGTGPFNYSWSNSLGSTQTVTGVPVGGPYTVTVTNGAGCPGTASASVTQPTVLTVSATGTNVSCFGGSNGTATATIAGGSGGNTIVWSPAPGGGQGTANATGLTAQTYTVTVTNTAGCTASATFTPTQPTLLSVTATGTNISCNGGNTGTATATITGGSGGNTIVWSPAPGGGQGTANATGLTAQTYTVTVTNAAGCTANATFTPTQPTALTGAIVTQTNVNCNGLTNGSVSVSASGGTSSYQYNIGAGNQASGNFTSLGAGSYTITITDQNGCTTTVPVTITQPTALSASIAPVALACNGVCNGAATVTASGGSGTYTYSWNNSTFSTTATTAANLCAQTYTVTVANAAAPACTTTASVTVTQPTAIALTSSSTNANCGVSTGTATVNPTGGAGGYTYSWATTPVQTTATAVALAAGAYAVTVTDANGCTSNTTVTVGNNSSPTASEVAASHVNVSCNGGNNGAAAVTVSGGTAPYTYTWSPSVSSGASATGLTAGTYNVTITDFNNCSAVVSIVITQPTALTAVAAVTTNVSCNAGATGSANVNVSGGAGGYSYNWFTGTAPAGTSIGQTGTSATGLVAGNYYVVVTDANGCGIFSNAITITQPTALTAAGVGTNPACNGASTGSINLTASGGTTPYTFAWTGPGAFVSNAEDPSALSAGTYNVTVTDGNGCTTTASVTLTNPALLTVSATPVDAHCGLSDGSASATSTGGTGAITFQWYSNAGLTTLVGTGASLPNVAANTYYVVATDANGCTVNTSTTIANLSGVTATATVTGNATGAGVCNGSASVTPSGGVSPYTYLWSNGATTAIATGLCAGSNCVTVTDASGCTINVCVTITEPAPLALNLLPTNLTCFGVCNGSISSAVSGGVSPYTYSWSNGSTTANITGICAGFYSLTVTDANGNTAVLSTTITQPTAVTITSTTPTATLCSGSCDGAVTAAASGGTGALTYSWALVGTGATQTGLCAGTYNLTVTDANGCPATASATVTSPSALGITIATVNANCGASNGSATATVTGGTTAYSYSWSAGSTTATQNSIPAGPVTVNVTDANGCTITGNATVANNPLGSLSMTLNNHVSCFGAANGSATATVTGGAGPYGYSWSSGQTTAAVNNFGPGTFTLTVTDANGCTLTDNVTITEPAALQLTPSSTFVTCAGGSDGSVTSVIAGGTTPYTINWTNAAGASVGTTQTVTGLVGGTYTISVTDANGCTLTASTTVAEPAAYSVTVTPFHVDCKDACSGSASAFVTGGTAPYNFVWNDPLTQITSGALFLCDGSYTVTVTDDNGCVITGSTVINEPALMVPTPSSVDAHCQQNDGSGCVAVTGGVSPYTFSWLSTGNTTNCQNNLFAGTYLVEITDANGCTDTSAIQVNDIAGPSAVIIASDDVNCFGGNDGSATVNMVGGTGIFTVLWDANAANQTTPTASNLSSGTYSVSVTDAAGCSASTNVTINEPADLIVIPNTVHPTCFTYCDGIAWLGVSGGTLPYTFDWRDGANNPLNVNNDSLTNLCAGNYTLIFTDANGCSEVLNYTLVEPPQVTATTSVTDNTCNSSCDGTATVNVTVGAGPFTYLWTDPAAQTTPTASGLCAGNYTITVTDDDGCFNSYTVNITEPVLLDVTLTASGDVSCSGACNGFAQVSVAGGTPPYQYNWSNGSLSAVNSNLCAGLYSLTVTDANGCTDTLTVNILQPNTLTLGVTGTDNTCFQSCDGTANAAISGGVTPYTIQWDNPTFSTTAAVTNLCAGTFNVVVTDANGCSVNGSVLIDQPAILDFAVSTQNSNCGQNNGFICSSVIGGVPPYTYSWSNGATSACNFNILAGCYTLTITDGNGCVKDSLICINDIAGPSVSITSFTDVICFGQNNGSIDISASGGVGTLTIEWLNGAGSVISSLNGSTASGNTLDGDTYGIVVTDTAGCIATTTQFIFEPNVVFAAITNTTQPLCFNGCDGTATVSVSGGLGAYTYAWVGGSSASAPTNTGLCAGTYDVTVTDANNCPALATATITQPTQLVASTLSTQNITCFGDCNGVINVNASGATAPYAYTWTSGVSTGPTATNLCPGAYSTSIADANGCTVVLNNTITEPALLVANITVTDATCGLCNGTATATVSGGTTPYSYQWGTGGAPTSAANTNMCAGNDNLTVTDDNGCIATGTSTINNLAGPVITGMTFTSPSCTGFSNGTATVNITGGTNPISYLWSDQSSQTTQTAVALVTGNYCVQVTDQNNCTANNCVNVTQPTPLGAVGDLDVTICVGDSTQVWGSGSGGTAPYIVNWAAGAGLTGPGPHLVEPVTTTTYCFTVTDANGCLSPSDCVTITVNPPLNVDVTAPTAICDGSSITLNAQATGGNGGPYTFGWVDEFGNSFTGSTSGNNSSVIVSPTVPTWYYVILNDGCSLPVIDSTQITINATPVVFLNVVNDEGCEPFTAQFILNTDIGTQFDYDFNCDGIVDYSGTNPNATYTYLSAGIYDVCVEVTSAQGCSTLVNQPQMVTVNPRPLADFSMTPGLTTILIPSIQMNDLSTGTPVIYHWDFGDGDTISGAPSGTVPAGTNGGSTTGTFNNPEHTYSDTGTFTVTLTITNQFGCTDQVSYTVTVEGDYILFTPNGFTPDGDGINDVFFPQGIGIDPERYELLIFNRWGELIFESYNPNNGWDGQYKGQKAKQDVYVWKVKAFDHKGQQHDYIGHITLLR
jgi:gliding motility-associated-like protein